MAEAAAMVTSGAKEGSDLEEIGEAVPGVARWRRFRVARPRLHLAKESSSATA